ncbi:MAG: hypothetical protein M3T96_03245 [Acidobacteriota bacterium]|nr:hypothetical protein [Acidobacteriota bacterium]
MKICPQCRTEYTDDALQYCLQDGAPLVNSDDRSAAFNTESETVVSPKRVEPIRFEPPSSYQNSRAEQHQSEPLIVEREPKKSNAATVAVLSVLCTLVVLGLIGAGAWLYFSNRKTVAVVNTNSVVAPNRAVNANTANGQNLNTNANVNANLATPTPAPTPAAKPTINPEQAKTITNDVKDVVGDWKSASEDLDITRHLSHYADTVDYYNGGKVGIAKVRADREKAFADYDSINLDIDNLRVIPDPSGDTATAIFDKGWKFEGTDKTSRGKVQQRLTLTKINGRWLISGEKDLRVYYKE